MTTPPTDSPLDAQTPPASTTPAAATPTPPPRRRPADRRSRVAVAAAVTLLLGAAVALSVGHPHQRSHPGPGNSPHATGGTPAVDHPLVLTKLPRGLDLRQTSISALGGTWSVEVSKPISAARVRPLAGAAHGVPVAGQSAVVVTWTFTPRPVTAPKSAGGVEQLAGLADASTLTLLVDGARHDLTSDSPTTDSGSSSGQVAVLVPAGAQHVGLQAGTGAVAQVVENVYAGKPVAHGHPLGDPAARVTSTISSCSHLVMREFATTHHLAASPAAAAPPTGAFGPDACTATFSGPLPYDATGKFPPLGQAWVAVDLTLTAPTPPAGTHPQFVAGAPILVLDGHTPVRVTPTPGAGDTASWSGRALFAVSATQGPAKVLEVAQTYAALFTAGGRGPAQQRNVQIHAVVRAQTPPAQTPAA